MYIQPKNSLMFKLLAFWKKETPFLGQKCKKIGQGPPPNMGTAPYNLADMAIVANMYNRCYYAHSHSLFCLTAWVYLDFKNIVHIWLAGSSREWWWIIPLWPLRRMEHLFAKILHLQEWLLYFPVIRGPLCIKGCATKAKRNGLSFPRLSRVLKIFSGQGIMNNQYRSTGTDLQSFTIIKTFHNNFPWRQWNGNKRGWEYFYILLFQISLPK